MTPRELANKAGPMLASPLALLLGILFFMPWLEIRCSGMEVASASGLQLSIGQLTPNEALDEQEPTGAQSQGQGAEAAPEIRARPWYGLSLASALAVLVVSVLALTGRMQVTTAGMAMIGAACVGLLMAVLAMNVDYDEVRSDWAREIRQDQRGRQEGSDTRSDAPDVEETESDMSDAFANSMEQGMKQGMEQAALANLRVEATPALWVSLVLYVLILLCGAGSMVAGLLVVEDRGPPADERSSAQSPMSV